MMFFALLRMYRKAPANGECSRVISPTGRWSINNFDNGAKNPLRKRSACGASRAALRPNARPYAYPGGVALRSALTLPRFPVLLLGFSGSRSGGQAVEPGLAPDKNVRALLFGGVRRLYLPFSSPDYSQDTDESCAKLFGNPPTPFSLKAALATLEMPVIVYLKLRETGHFSVLRGVNASTVWLADPSLGNRTYSREQFLSLWDTEARAQTASEAQGRVLAILPTGAGLAAQSGFFTKKLGQTIYFKF